MTNRQLLQLSHFCKADVRDLLTRRKLWKCFDINVHVETYNQCYVLIDFCVNGCLGIRVDIEQSIAADEVCHEVVFLGESLSFESIEVYWIGIAPSAVIEVRQFLCIGSKQISFSSFQNTQAIIETTIVEKQCNAAYIDLTVPTQQQIRSCLCEWFQLISCVFIK